jgi:hypothetical protein
MKIATIGEITEMGENAEMGKNAANISPRSFPVPNKEPAYLKRGPVFFVSPLFILSYSLEVAPEVA